MASKAAKNHTLRKPWTIASGAFVVLEAIRMYTPGMTEPVVGTQPEVSGETDQPVRPERVVVSPAADSRLEALHAQYEGLKQAEIEAKRKFKELKSAIAAELEAQYQGNERPSHTYQIPASIYGPELMVYYKSQDYMPDSVIRDNFPDIWAALKREKTYTEVRAAQQRNGGPRRRR